MDLEQLAVAMCARRNELPFMPTREQTLANVGLLFLILGDIMAEWGFEPQEVATAIAAAEDTRRVSITAA